MADYPTVSRRGALSAAAGGLAAVGLGAAGVTSAGPADARARRRLRPISMAMHIHASFSEGVGSYEGHLQQAREHDVDVIWWTDHDFRVAAHDYREDVHFTGVQELEGELTWTWARRDEGTLSASTVEFVTDPRSPEDPPSALRLAATGAAPTGGTAWYAGTAWNFTYGTCIADTTLKLDVLPELVGPAAAFILHIDLSHHPARAGRPAGTYRLRYRVGGMAERRVTAAGLVGTVDLPAGAGEWATLRLNLVADVHELWPDLVAEDNALRNLRVGMSVGAGEQGSVVVDRLRFRRTRRDGQEGERLREEVLRRYREEYPDVTHYPAYEVSLVRHLNWYGGDQTLPAFPSPPYRDNDPALTRSMVDFLHAHGGIVCWNHPLDVETRESLATLMIEQDNLGADLVEIGRDRLEDLLWVFDVAARNAVFFTAVGASDDHDGRRWLQEPERWITYAWARSTSRDALVRALRAGRAWFTDPAAYRGTMAIKVAGGSVMGGVVLTRSRRVTVDLRAADLPVGAALEIITGAVDLAGTADLTPATTSVFVPAAEVPDGRHRVRIKPGSGVYVRTQVRAADGSVVAVTNPVWLLPAEPPGGVPRWRSITA
ncbi:MAG TPA: hypothetical protein VES42_18485 [Pilimelia sp.]|nr:hypothetical protein [Pilimelia sp.]